MALYYPPTINGLQKTLDSQLNSGVTAQMTLNNTTGVQNKAGIVVVDRIDTTGKEKSTSVREYIAYSGVSGNNLVGLTRGLGGSSDQDHAVGAVVEFVPDVTVFQAIIDTITTEHNEDGTHKSFTLSSPKISGGIYDTNNKELLKLTATASAVNSLELSNAASGNNPVMAAVGTDTNIGLDLKPKGTGVFRVKQSVSVPIIAPTMPVSTGDGKFAFAIPAELNGMDLVSVIGYHVTKAGSSGTCDVQIARDRGGTVVDVLSTKLTIDANERDSTTAATPVAINTSYDDVQTGDIYRFDIDAIPTGTAPQGLIVNLQFALP